MDGKELMTKLCDSFGISGSEYRLHSILEEYFNEYTDEIQYGVLHDFIGVKKGSRNGNGVFKIMLAAHADEVGLIVKSINDHGFIEFANVCGVDPKTLPAQEVILYGKREVYGVIGAKPPHVLTPEDMKKAIKLEDMVIDVGMTKEEASELINVGDFITIKRQCASLLGDFVTGKALDNRCGIAAMYECAKELSKMKHAADVYFVATSLEERGGLGARTTAYQIAPDIGIAVDVDFGDKYAYADAITECGKGTEIAIGPNMHPELTERMIEVADKYNIRYELDVSGGIPGTDASDIQIARDGIPTLLLSIPLRYMHTSTEVVCYKDVIETGKLLTQFIASIQDWGEIYA